VSEKKPCSIFVANAIKEVFELRQGLLFSDIVFILCNCNNNVISRYLAILRLCSLVYFLYIFLCTYLFAVLSLYYYRVIFGE